MRYLIFGDVHGNLVALEKMLQKAGPEVDFIVSHGDVVNYGPWSNECVQLLQNIQCKCLLGNHESYFIEGNYPGENKIAQIFFNHCYESFNQQEVISAYGDNIQVGDFEIQHTVNNQYIFPDTDLNALNLKLNYIVGHSHYQFSGKTEDGKLLINTGSVGQNRKFINLINYIIYDTVSSEIKLESIVYDINPVINKMKSEKYPQLCIDYYLNKNKQ
ncbi:metallophosphoesterase [Pontibacter sp. HSC-14F20]|uniref:metallophosphoesterase family protein n=1 Tax=Pontibacter sp. HSC-14F20 TaxID=2864136 RepID=UPI001C734DF0|nr:metallophosphoesterase [Pontibacter sp. HSC-14F20]MBX0333255.1 metallophosphoesterase [Pontibacter sp. HSC-14F20]